MRLICATTPRSRTYGSTQRAEKVADAGDELLVRRAIPETATLLPKGVVVIYEADEIAADLAAVQVAIALCLQTVEERLGVTQPLDHPRQITGKAEVENGI
jgi:hypothetical protein